jgi:hypothetical protein
MLKKIFLFAYPFALVNASQIPADTVAWRGESPLTREFNYANTIAKGLGAYANGEFARAEDTVSQGFKAYTDEHDARDTQLIFNWLWTCAQAKSAIEEQREIEELSNTDKNSINLGFDLFHEDQYRQALNEKGDDMSDYVANHQQVQYDGAKDDPLTMGSSETQSPGNRAFDPFYDGKDLSPPEILAERLSADIKLVHFKRSQTRFLKMHCREYRKQLLYRLVQARLTQNGMCKNVTMYVNNEGDLDKISSKQIAIANRQLIYIENQDAVITALRIPNPLWAGDPAHATEAGVNMGGQHAKGYEAGLASNNGQGYITKSAGTIDSDGTSKDIFTLSEGVLAISGTIAGLLDGKPTVIQTLKKLKLVNASACTTYESDSSDVLEWAGQIKESLCSNFICDEQNDAFSKKIMEIQPRHDQQMSDKIPLALPDTRSEGHVQYNQHKGEWEYVSDATYVPAWLGQLCNQVQHERLNAGQATQGDQPTVGYEILQVNNACAQWKYHQCTRYSERRFAEYPSSWGTHDYLIHLYEGYEDASEQINSPPDFVGEEQYFADAHIKWMEQRNKGVNTSKEQEANVKDAVNKTKESILTNTSGLDTGGLESPITRDPSSRRLKGVPGYGDHPNVNENMWVHGHEDSNVADECVRARRLNNFKPLPEFKKYRKLDGYHSYDKHGDWNTPHQEYQHYTMDGQKVPNPGTGKDAEQTNHGHDPAYGGYSSNVGFNQGPDFHMDIRYNTNKFNVNLVWSSLPEPSPGECVLGDIGPCGGKKCDSNCCDDDECHSCSGEEMCNNGKLQCVAPGTQCKPRTLEFYPVQNNCTHKGFEYISDWVEHRRQAHEKFVRAEYSGRAYWSQISAHAASKLYKNINDEKNSMNVRLFAAENAKCVSMDEAKLFQEELKFLRWKRENARNAAEDASQFCSTLGDNFDAEVANDEDVARCRYAAKDAMHRDAVLLKSLDEITQRVLDLDWCKKPSCTGKLCN